MPARIASTRSAGSSGPSISGSGRIDGTAGTAGGRAEAARAKALERVVGELHLPDPDPVRAGRAIGVEVVGERLRHRRDLRDREPHRPQPPPQQPLGDHRPRARAEAGPGMRARADVPEPLDRRRVPGAGRQRAPEQVLVERRAAPEYGSPWWRLTFAACRSAGERVTRLRIELLEVRHVPRDPRLDAVGVALAQLLGPRPVAGRRARRPRRPSRCQGSSCSWIQSSPAPSGARLGSIVSGWPTTTVASAGSSPRSASLTARETPSRPGVRCTIAVCPSRSSPSQRGGSDSAKWICISERP